ncbi:SWR1 complex bromodomain subunit bdf1-like [Limulus polyphemus]|uniref:SWR1 complex bromodomain subunit bdf1-like n=1 Tax=Limulus polyphemus TaxID=6850 RepID=A0ABM1TFV4_LIMPO|nr:SWR1 complex bromodomain subunit bdf1-like [Limulus polyphemus]
MVLWEVKSKPESWPFLCPVDEADAPGYYSIVQDPIDLMTIERKIDCREYTNREEFLKDFKKMVDNCQQYNGNRSVYMTMARKIWKYFLQSMKKNFPDELNDNASQVVNIVKQKSSSDITIGLDLKKDISSKILRQNVRGGKSKKKRKKRQPGIKAIEVLAKAAEKALQDTTLQDELHQINLTSNNTSLTTVSSAFPDLKISTIQSHPDDLLLRYCPDNFFCTSAKLKDLSEPNNIHTSQPCSAENEFLYEPFFNDCNTCTPSITEQATQDISSIEQKSPQNSSTIKFQTAQYTNTIKHQITAQHSSTGEQHNTQRTNMGEQHNAQRISTEKQQTAQHSRTDEEHSAHRTNTDKQQTAQHSSIGELHSPQRTNTIKRHNNTSTAQNTNTIEQSVNNMSIVEKSNAQSASFTKHITGEDINFTISHSPVSHSVEQDFIEIKGIDEEVTSGKVEKLNNPRYVNFKKYWE